MNLTIGDTLLKDTIQVILMLPEWVKLKLLIANTLLISNSSIDYLCEPSLHEQLLLNFVGIEIRKIWNKNDKFNPELIRDPYIERSRADTLSSELEDYLCKALKDTIATYEENKLDEIIKFRVELKRVLNQLIFHKQKSINLSNYELMDIIGDAIISTITLRQKKLDTMGYLLTSGSGIGIKIDKKNENLKSDNNDNIVDKYHDDFSDIENILNSYDINDIQEISIKLKGTFLTDSLRKILYSYRYLYRTLSDPPMGILLVKELSRLAQKKGITINNNNNNNNSNNDNIKDSGNMSEFVTGAVQLRLRSLFETSYILVNQAKSQIRENLNSINDNNQIKTIDWFNKLYKRAELLTLAGYTLTGVLSDRLIMVSLIVMRALPDEPPTSEVSLRLVRRIMSECLPSEQLHREYSIGSVALSCWLLLKNKDIKLYTHLQADNDNKNSKVEVSRSLTLLRGWMETGFLGYIPEYAALFIWDQLVLYGGRPIHFKELLPLISCELLLLMREELLSTYITAEKLKLIGKNLKTIDIIKVLKPLLLV